MRFRTSSAVLTLAVLSVAFPATPAVAGNAPITFTVTPSRLELRMLPGEIRSTSIRVYNDGTEPLRLLAYVRNIDVPAGNLVGEDELRFSASNWMTFARPGLEVLPGRSADAVLTVSVPPDAVPGGYHAFAYVQSATEPTSATVVPSGRIGSTALIEVAPPGFTLTRSARVATMRSRVSWSGFFRASVRTDTTVQNTGDVHVLCGGLHSYRGWPGRDGRTKVGPYLLLHGTRYTFSSTKAAPIFGRVVVTSEIVYQRGPNDFPAIVEQRTVWIIPWRMFGLAGLLVTAALIARRRRSTARSLAKTRRVKPILRRSES